MSNDFYAALAQQLCSIKNSPFSLLSTHSNHEFSASNLIRSKRLSYDPDRFFNPQKKSARVVDDEAYIEIQRQEKEDLQKIEIQLLKQRTKEQLLNLKQTSEISKCYSFTHPFSIFKSYRALCNNCNKCYEYNGNFNIGSTLVLEGTNKQVEYLCCTTCSCPMNSHQSVRHKNRFSGDIFSYLSTHTVSESQLSIKFFPICFGKEINKESPLPALLNNFFNYLPQLGLKIISHKILSKKQFQLFMIKKEILSGTQKQTVERLLNFVSFLQHHDSWNWKQSLNQGIDQDYFEIIKKIKGQLKIQLSNNEQALVFFVDSLNSLDSIEIRQILNHFSNSLRARFLWTSKESKDMFLSSCLLFPEHYVLTHQIFVLPSQKTDEQIEKVTARFKDLLDYNNYITIGQLKSIQSAKLHEILKDEDPNKLNYIMGRDQLNNIIKRVRILLSAKVGPSIFTIPFKNAVDFIEISSQRRKASFMMAFPQYLRSQRCIIILRPSFTLSNLDEVVMTLLRVNNFIMLKRRRIILSNQEANYLATLQKIDPKDLESYLKMMTSGASQIVLVSKRAAIYEANILLNGSKDCLSDTRLKAIRQIPMIKVKRGTETYEYKPVLKAYEGEKRQCFSSISELFRIEDILFPQYVSDFKFMTNEKTGQVIKIDNEILSNNGSFSTTSKTEELMLKQIKKDFFNYCAFSSKSQFLTEQLAGIFMPETTLFQSCLVIVKPRFVHLTGKIRQALAQHRYHIIAEKTVLLSQKLAYQMIINLSKTPNSNSEVKKCLEVYSTENIHIFCISKVFAKQEIFSLLSNFSFLSETSTVIMQYIDDWVLKEALIPVWNNQEFVLKILSAPLYNIEEAIHSLQAPDIKSQDKLEILNYMVGSCFGVGVQDLTLNSMIGKFSYYITTAETANMQSWFYSQLSKLCARYVPTLFQHRLVGETCFVIQSYIGYPFLNLISNQYQEEKQKIQHPNNDSRKSLVLYLWGKQLAKFINSISSKDSYMKGWGSLLKRNYEWQGKYFHKDLIQKQRTFLQDSAQKLHNDYEIKLHIQRVLQSRFLNEKYNHENKKKFIPHFIEGKIDECIRIIQTQQTSKLHLVDKYSMIDPQHQKSNQKSLYTLSLFNIEPSIGTKEELIVQIMIFLLRLQNDNEEFKEMFSLLFQYFIEHILEHSESDILEYEFYIRLLKEYFLTKEDWIKQKLRVYPNLKKIASDNNSLNEEISGKKRKFLEKRQYFKDNNHNLTEEQKKLKNKEYKNFNLNYEVLERQKDFDKNNPLLNMKDPFHRKITLEERPISLLREQPQLKKEKTGIYVEFQKKITQNEELLINKVKGQVDKFNLEREDKILYETGLQNELWYRKTKGEKLVVKKGKVDDAIQKQISKLLDFKKTDKNLQNNSSS